MRSIEGVTTLLAYVSQTQSLINLFIAALISTAMIGVGISGLFRQPRGEQASLIERVRWLWAVPGVVGGGVAVLLALGELRLDGDQVLALLLGVPIALLISLALVVRGWRGRRVGDHPHCRRCGFDLFGKPADSDVCSECGADLNQPSAVVVGVRVRRLGLVLGGVFLLILSMALGAAATRHLRGGPTLRRIADASIQYQPDWWLVRDLTGTNRAGKRSTWDELNRRLHAGSLSRSAAEGMVAAMRTQDLSSAARMAGEAWAQGRLSEETMRDVMKRSMAVKLRVAPRSARGHAIRVKLEPVDRLLGLGGWPTPSRPGSTIQVDALRWKVEGVELPPGALGQAPFREPALMGVVPGTPTSLAPLPRQLEQGVVRVQVSGEVVVTYAQHGRPTLVEKQTLEETGTTALVDPAVLHCQPVLDVGDRRVRTGAVTTRPSAAAAAPPPSPTASLYIDSGGSARLSLSIGSSPGAFLGDVFARSAGVERKLGSVLLYPTSTINLAAPLPADADLVLRPTPERGVELFREVRTYQTQIIIPASSVERLTRAGAGWAPSTAPP